MSKNHLILLAIPGKLRVLIILFVLFVCVSSAAEGKTLRLLLNHLEIGIDEDTGSIIFLGSDVTGPMLEAEPQSAGLVDVAYPLPAFGPLRLASRFSNARVEREGKGLTIYWEALGPSRSNFELPPGKVSAQVTIRPADDGRSVILDCHIENHSSAPVPQILFPDLWGLKSFAGVHQTELRLPRGVVYPFTVPFRSPESAPPYYDRIGWQAYPAGGYYAQNALRWLDYGSFRGGVSIFQKQWCTADRPNVYTYRSQRDPDSLRLTWEHIRTIEPGQTWDSGEFWLTPHAGGWAKGIEVFRKYVLQVNPPRPLPPVVRDGLGFQTIWMTQAMERDPRMAAFRYRDIPHVAEDARRNGINQLVLWNWSNSFQLPVAVLKELGSETEFLEAIRSAERLGVDVAPFISVHITLNDLASRYGMKPGHDNWTYHPELLPQFAPYYTHEFEGAFVDDNNEIWQRDVLDTLKAWIDKGVYSWSWDQFMYDLADGQSPGLVQLMAKIRDLARKGNPEATFGSESVTGLEFDGRILDYTWDWVDYVDAAPILNVLRTPRLNCNVDDSPLVVKRCFADGLYLNVMPSKPDEPNGTALISSKRDLAAAVQETAQLRSNFLPYFADGVFIGDSVLWNSASAFVRGHQLGKKLLITVLNDHTKPQPVRLESHLDLWLPIAPSYVVRYYNSVGRLIETGRWQGTHWTASTHPLQPQELAFFEIEATEPSK
jgi:hypothetical protein